MNTLTIEGWCKTSADAKSTPVGDIRFYVCEPVHLLLEQAEERLNKTHEAEIMVDVDLETLNLEVPAGYGPLSDCRMRVYLSEDSTRGQFHLVGHRESDGSLIYTNAVMIDQLG